MCVRAHSLSRIQLFVTPLTVDCQAPLSMGFFRQEYWSGLPFPPPGDLPNPGIEPTSAALAGKVFTKEPQLAHLANNTFRSYFPNTTLTIKRNLGEKVNSRAGDRTVQNEPATTCIRN